MAVRVIRKGLLLLVVFISFWLIVSIVYAYPLVDVDAQDLDEREILFSADFEGGYVAGIDDWSQAWMVETEGDAQAIFCNQIRPDWVSFQFGLESWENYAVSLRMKILSNNAEQSAEIHARVNTASEGYRASIWNRNTAIINHWPPPLMEAAEPVSFRLNEWEQLRFEVYGNHLAFYINDTLRVKATDDRRSAGRAGVAVSPNTEACVDDILVWKLDENGIPVERTPSGVESLAQYEGDCVFCFIYTDPLAPIWDDQRQGYVPRSDDAREQAVIDQNFTVPARGEVVFENQIVWMRSTQHKDIDIFGRLIFRNSLILWDQTAHQQTVLNIKRAGELRIENSYAFAANQYWWNWSFDDGATVYYDRFVGNPWTTMTGAVTYTAINYSTVKLTFFQSVQDSVVTVTDAHHVWFEIFPPTGGEYTLTFPEKRQWADWDLSQIWPNTVVSVGSSYIYERDISVDINTHVTITDTPSGFGMGWAIHKDDPGFVECEIHNLGEPGNREGVYYQNHVWDLPCVNSSLTVKNSVLQQAWPFTWGYVHLQVYESSIVDLRNYGGPSTIEIVDSSIDLVSSEQGGAVFIMNSDVRFGIEVRDGDSAIYTHEMTSSAVGRELEIIVSDGGRYGEIEALAHMRATRNANLRTCASTRCEIGTSVTSGDLLHVIGEESGEVVAGTELWYEVVANGHVLYIHSSLVDPMTIRHR